MHMPDGPHIQTVSAAPGDPTAGVFGGTNVGQHMPQLSPKTQLRRYYTEQTLHSSTTVTVLPQPSYRVPHSGVVSPILVMLCVSAHSTGCFHTGKRFALIQSFCGTNIGA